MEDAFMAFYFRFLEPNRSRLELGGISSVLQAVRRQYAGHVAEVWEHLARRSVPRLGIGDREWGPGSRWWGTGSDGRSIEVDVVAESVDGRAVLMGEVKWGAAGGSAAARRKLIEAAGRCPFVRGREVVPALWTRRRGRCEGMTVLSPDDVLDVMRDR
jgi:hypothetical protein